MFFAVETERRSRAEYLAEVSRAFDQIAASAEYIFDQDWVADHHRLAEDRQIDGERAAITSAQTRDTTSHSAVKNTMPWMVFGIRGPGGSRTGSVVAVAMSSPVRTGHPNLSVQVAHCIRAGPCGVRPSRGFWRVQS